MGPISVLLVWLVAISVSRTEVEAKMSISRDPEGPIYVKENEDALLTLNITDLERSIFLKVHSSDSSTFTVQENATFYLDVISEKQLTSSGNSTQDLPNPGANFTIMIWVTGKFIGIRELVFSISNIDTPYLDYEDTDILPHVVKVLRKPNQLVAAFNYILILWLIFSYISMGSTMDWDAIWSKLKKPFGVIIGLLCQFIVMPALAFSLAKMLRLDNAAALGLIIIGCCPGGWVSNIYSLLLDCDLTLSVTMTVCSTVLALGTMPANLFIYGTPFTSADDNLAIPYAMTVAQILMLVVPVLFGMLLYYKVPKIAAILGKFLRLIAVIMIIVGISFGIPSNLYAFYAPLDIVFVALLLPIIGSVLGLLLAKASCLYNTSAVTVALETGAQNSLIGALIAQFSFPQPEADLIGRIPLMVAIFTLIYGAVVTVIYQIMKKYPGRIHVPEKNEQACRTCGVVPAGMTKGAENKENQSDLEGMHLQMNNSTPMEDKSSGVSNKGFDDNDIAPTPMDSKNTENYGNITVLSISQDMNGNNNNSDSIESTHL